MPICPENKSLYPPDWADNPWVVVYEWSPLAPRDEGAA
jgi:hypothetical protein